MSVNENEINKELKNLLHIVTDLEFNIVKFERKSGCYNKQSDECRGVRTMLGFLMGDMHQLRSDIHKFNREYPECCEGEDCAESLIESVEQRLLVIEHHITDYVNSPDTNIPFDKDEFMRGVKKVSRALTAYSKSLVC